jgi:hypothetical protein
MRFLKDLDVCKTESHDAVIITPECAARALASNHGNRRLKKAQVSYLSQMIQNGEWRPDHPCQIVFSSSGRLIDGQHRLNACIVAGQPIVVRVVCGADESLKRYLGGGVPRNTSDQLTIEDGEPKSLREIQVATLWTRVAHAKRTDTSFQNGWKPTPKMVADMIDAHRDAIAWSAAHRMRHQNGIKRTGVCLPVAMLYEINPDDAQRFADALCVIQAEIQQAALLREFLLGRWTHVGGSTVEQAILEKSIFAVRSFINGKPIRSLKMGGLSL